MGSTGKDGNNPDLMKGFNGLARQLNASAEQAVTSFANEVTIILQTQSTDCQLIEQLLDRMLNFFRCGSFSLVQKTFHLLL